METKDSKTWILRNQWYLFGALFILGFIVGTLLSCFVTKTRRRLQRKEEEPAPEQQIGKANSCYYDVTSNEINIEDDYQSLKEGNAGENA